jgi:hypothetical protein
MKKRRDRRRSARWWAVAADRGREKATGAVLAHRPAGVQRLDRRQGVDRAKQRAEAR